jgi:hypothetical protein
VEEVDTEMPALRQQEDRKGDWNAGELSMPFLRLPLQVAGAFAHLAVDWLWFLLSDRYPPDYFLWAIVMLFGGEDYEAPKIGEFLC